MALYSREGMVLDRKRLEEGPRTEVYEKMTPVAHNVLLLLPRRHCDCRRHSAVITRRNPVHSALSLILTLLALAGLYLMLYAPFVAGVQIVLYAGGIMVLFLFVIMLVNLEKDELEEQFNKQWLVASWLPLCWADCCLFVLRDGQGRCSRRKFALTAGRERTRSRSDCSCTRITCCRSKSPRCCCWWRSSAPCHGEEEESEIYGRDHKHCITWSWRPRCSSSAPSAC